VWHSFLDIVPFRYRDSEEYLIMALDLECYFDAGNQPVSSQHELVTLSVISGTPKQWRKLEQEWTAKFPKHHIRFFHATEHKNRPGLMEDFAMVAHENTFRRNPFRHGLYPFSVTIPLKDFLRARKVNPRIPQDVPDVLIREALYRCVEWGRTKIGARKYHMVFDQSEAYYGYVSDFKHNPKAQRESPILKRFALTEDNMRDWPGLQVADLFAFSHGNRQTYSRTTWHKLVRSIEQDRVDFTYRKLLHPLDGPINKRLQWKLPKRAATK
jgi:hypothetical protein